MGRVGGTIGEPCFAIKKNNVERIIKTTLYENTLRGGGVKGFRGHSQDHTKTPSLILAGSSNQIGNQHIYTTNVREGAPAIGIS